MVVATTALPLQSQEPGRASQQTSQPLQHQLSASRPSERTQCRRFLCQPWW